MANESLRCLGLVRSYAGPLIPMRRTGHATEVAPMMRLLTYWNSKRRSRRTDGRAVPRSARSASTAWWSSG